MNDEFSFLLQLYQKQKFQEVITKGNSSKKALSKHFGFWEVMGASYMALKNPLQGEKCFLKVVKLAPERTQAHYNLGCAYVEQDKIKKAILSFKKTIQLNPNNSEALNSLGYALYKTNQHEDGLKYLQKCLRITPNHFIAVNNVGLCYLSSNEHDLAVKNFQKAIKINPNYTTAHLNLGTAYIELGHVQEAKKIFTSILEHDGNNTQALFNMGLLFLSLFNEKKAIEYFERVLQLDSEYKDARRLSANILVSNGSLEEATWLYKEELKIHPSNLNAENGLGYIYSLQKNWKDAWAAYDRALKIDPTHTTALARQYFIAANTCNWSKSKDVKGQIDRIKLEDQYTTPFPMLGLEDNPANQYARAQAYVKRTYKISNSKQHSVPSQRPEKIRIAYFSSDFNDHPVTHLIIGLLKQHDRDRFETFAFSISTKKPDAYSELVENAVDHYFCITRTNKAAVQEICDEHEIDIAIDLNGYTEGARTNLFQNRIAPIQVNYLGYPGTMGAEFMDYIIADKILIPDNLAQFYSEKIIYMPHCYQPNDDTREISDLPRTRKDYNLPEDAFVFCCFNSSYKITPSEYDIWMRLLAKKESSVLWLRKTNKQAEENLKKEAEKRGIDSKRIIFTEKVSMEEHLQRHQFADLFLDTFNYNAHTTASDALWAGLPLVTKTGQQYAARVGA